MRVAEWARGLANRPPLQEVIERFGEPCFIRSVPLEARAPLLAASYLRQPRKLLIVAPTWDRCLQWQAKLTLCGIPEHRILQLPSGSSALFDDASPEQVALSDRIGALRALASEAPMVVVGLPQSVLERTLPKELLLEATVDITPGFTIEMKQWVRKLKLLGYERAEPVRMPGQYSVRGGIVDIFASGRDLPIRLEFFGDEIETIREFDPTTQRSVRTLPVASLAPSRETLFDFEDGSGLKAMLLEVAEREAAQLGGPEGDQLIEHVRSDAELIASRQFFDRLDLYRPFLHPESGSAVDLLGEDGLLVIDEPDEIEAIATRSEEDLAQALDNRHRRGEILHSTANDFQLPTELFASHQAILGLSVIGDPPSWMSMPMVVDLEGGSLETYKGRPTNLAITLKRWQEQNYTLIVATDQPSRAKTVLSQVEIFPEEETSDVQAPGLHMVSGNLGGGFSLASARVALITDAELFGVARLKLPQKRFLEGVPITTLLDLKAGDFVVHINFGIGIFRGLVKRQVEGGEKEFLFIEYAAPDRLFVPTDQLDRVQKYLNPGDSEPKVNRLVGGDWQRTIKQAREDARAFAQDLIKLYAQRRAVQRNPFDVTTPWQSEMEATFPWVETPSQLRAIQETKIDLAADCPMDRLVCGDVGFGKTEVAIRATFAVIQNRRQVAVLCPTTILSEQHFRSFAERLAPFGVRMALLNRFRTAKERKEVLADLESGNLDLVIGTHSLLSKEIKFHDLGMVVIDEEQKFGVKQKELLKQLRTSVDVLSLSATPIPRTLSMALMDIRQMSLINDPPPGRLPIRTFVRPYSKEVVREAVLRELARGGQVYYVYNRVQGIQHVAELLQKLVPMARIGVGHGQMGEKELEPVMIGFIRGEIDVLVSTTIVENGLDIPTANTLIVENADQLGLAQLYQLRGRVGRSDRQAYAYLFYGGTGSLSENATARLTALQEFSNLGSGYSLAFRDLQIRGAGELLGAKQHGAMATVGYELYTQLISEAVMMLKMASDGQEPKSVDQVLADAAPLPTFELPVRAFLPDDYVRQQPQRLYYYQQLMSCRDPHALSAVEKEIEDRYGHAPEEAKNAFRVLGLRMRAKGLGIDKIDGQQGRLAITFIDRAKIPPRAFVLLAKKNRDSFLTKEQLVFPLRSDPITAVDRFLDQFRDALDQIEASRASIDY